MEESNDTIPDWLQGVIAPMFTPVHADYSIDYPGAASFVEWLISRRCVSSVFARCGMGKMYTFTMDETRRMGETVVRAAGGRIPILLGAGGEWPGWQTSKSPRPDPQRYLAQAIELTRFCMEIGAHAAVHVLPEAIAPARGETPSDVTFRYLAAVHEAADIPIVLYQHGGQLPEFRMRPDLLFRIRRELPRVIGMKISTHDEALFAPLAEIVRSTPFSLISGDETYYLRALELGADGVIGEGCNVYPEILAAVKTYYDQDRFEDAANAHADVMRALNIKTGLDGNTTWKQVLMRNGVHIEPFDRNRRKLASSQEVDRVVRDLDAILKPYRS